MARSLTCFVVLNIACMAWIEGIPLLACFLSGEKENKVERSVDQGKEQEASEPHIWYKDIIYIDDKYPFLSVFL